VEDEAALAGVEPAEAGLGVLVLLAGHWGLEVVDLDDAIALDAEEAPSRKSRMWRRPPCAATAMKMLLGALERNHGPGRPVEDPELLDSDADDATTRRVVEQAPIVVGTEPGLGLLDLGPSLAVVDPGLVLAAGFGLWGPQATRSSGSKATRALPPPL
jgi:hypothetical protein